MVSKETSGHKGWWLIALQSLLLVFLILFGINYQREFEENLTGKYRQQLTNTASTAKISVLNYFEKFSGNLVNLSHDPAIIEMARTAKASGKNTGYCPMENLFRVHRHEIDALILMDTSSLVIKRIADDTLVFQHMMCIGNERANPHVPADSVYYSDIFINHRNQKAITLSCPVYYYGIRVGILRWMITIESINNHFLNIINSDRQAHFIITDNNGRLLSNPELFKDWLCKNMCRCKEFRIQGSVVKDYKMLTSEGSGNLNLLPFCCRVNAAWSSFSMGNKEWKLMVMLPVKELENAMWKHGAITWVIIAFAFVIIISMTILIVTTRSKKLRLETEAGYLGKLALTQSQLREEREKRLSAQIAGQERERKRISRELHDGLGQLLLTMKLRLNVTNRKNASSGNGHENLIQQEQEIQEMLGKTIEEVKRISYGLSPVLLDELGIIKALERYCQDMSQMSGLTIEFVNYGITGFNDQEKCTHIYRIVQEAVTNGVKHGNPTEINVQLLAGNERITLMIQDDGNGFDIDLLQNGEGNGIANMRDRAKILGGDFMLSSKPGEGTSIIVKIPL